MGEKDYVQDPNPDAPRHHNVELKIIVPTYGKLSDGEKTAQSIKEILQTGLHSRIKVLAREEPPDRSGGVRWVEVKDREYRKVI